MSGIVEEGRVPAVVPCSLSILGARLGQVVVFVRREQDPCGMVVLWERDAEGCDLFGRALALRLPREFEGAVLDGFQVCDGGVRDARVVRVGGCQL